MSDMADRKFDYEEPRLTERQKRLDAEDVYWCGSERLELCKFKGCYGTPENGDYCGIHERTQSVPTVGEK